MNKIDEIIEDMDLKEFLANGHCPEPMHMNTLKDFAKNVVLECCKMVNGHVQWNNPNDCLLVLDIKEKFRIDK